MTWWKTLIDLFRPKPPELEEGLPDVPVTENPAPDEGD